MKGSLGSYKPVEWTSGGVEVIDIHDEGELYAKLPLGAASLGSRMQSGEKFHMEYYVSGTRTATRDRVFRRDVAKLKACEGATHFVYGFNLGACALASKSSLKGEANGSYFGFGAGGNKASGTQADKKGGDLALCKGESAKEVESCKVPVRLTLRAIDEGENPDVAASTAPETDASLNLAGQLKIESESQKQAADHLASAQTKKQSKDGKSCLAELDQHDALDPRPLGLSTHPASGKIAGLRAECLMLSGQCNQGKTLFRKAVAATKGGEVGPDRIDVITDAEAAMYCQGSKLSDRDAYLKAMHELEMGGLGVQKKSVAECQGAFDTFMKLRKVVARKDEDDANIPEKPLIAMAMPAPSCFARAGDCDAAFKAFKAINDAPDYPLKAKGNGLRSNFEGLVAKCRGNP